MIEFDKWSKEDYYTFDDLCRTDAMKVAWKAALKWVLNHPDLIDHYQLDYVKEELNAEV